MKNLESEINRRRTFAIISHPDAGKTTLTEKFLLYGGAIQSAGTVKGKRSGQHAVSDWMEIEKKRGISVTSSVLQFQYNNFCINILDTPGHQDFSEDTYRTLMAADAAVMVIDASKGVEAQTKKLFKVCMLRDIPIFTFVNKMDRQAMDPFKLMDHIQEELDIATYPMNWPVGCGREFQGVYERDHKNLLMFEGGNHGSSAADMKSYSLEKLQSDDILETHYLNQLLEDIELLDIAADEFDLEKIKRGELSPVFFGSALTNFGVQPFLEHFLTLSPSPLPRVAHGELIEPVSEEFSAFVFKIQANMNKAHRDRIAFLRICSGKYEKGLEVFHIQQNKKIRLSQPQQFMAQDREIVEEAYAGDVIGVFDPGMFAIGDTLCTSTHKFEFDPIPTFSPEHFARITQKDTMKRKQFTKGIVQIAQEGGIQIFQGENNGMEEIYAGAVGVLQFDVLEQRLLSEYNVEIKLEITPYQCVRWIEDQSIDTKTLNLTGDTKRMQDLKGKKLLLFKNQWGIKWALDQNKTLKLKEFGEYNG